jgi:transcriptional repressor NF-X1
MQRGGLESTSAVISAVGELLHYLLCGMIWLLIGWNRYFDCGEHQCQKDCHPQDLDPAHCPLSPDVVLTCPCTKHTVQEILGHPRETCTDPIPTCKDLCSKMLPCGHFCKQSCHTGTCWPCLEKVTVPCMCGYNQIRLPWYVTCSL